MNSDDATSICRICMNLLLKYQRGFASSFLEDIQVGHKLLVIYTNVHKSFTVFSVRRINLGESKS